MTLRAVVLCCSLKPSPAPSSSELLGREVLTALADHDVTGEVIRVVDRNVRFGVSTDEGDGDGWPELRARILQAQILVIATPIWMGQPSSVCKMVLERLDAELSERDEQGRPLIFGKAAAVAVVGNEDGAHHVVAEVLQALNDVGFSIAGGGRHVLGRRGDGLGRLRRRGAETGHHGRGHEDGGGQHRTPGTPAGRRAVPAELSGPAANPSRRGSRSR